MAVCAVLAGAITFDAIADWAADLDTSARRRLGFLGRIPAGSTVWRSLIRVDAQVLQAASSQYSGGNGRRPGGGTADQTQGADET